MSDLMMIFMSLLFIFWVSTTLGEKPRATNIGISVVECASEVKCPGIGPCRGSCCSLSRLLCFFDACAAFSGYITKVGLSFKGHSTRKKRHGQEHNFYFEIKRTRIE